MRRVFVLVAAPIFLGAAVFLAPAGERPDPVPVVSGMVFVPAGEFIMGSTIEQVRKGAEFDEFPQRKVWVDDYYIDVHEVTNVQYKYYVDSMGVDPPYRWIDGNYPIGRDGYPITDITWEEAAAYARFVGKRLPTEAEWEKAARGADGRRYPWGDEFDDALANCGNRLLPVMSIPAGNSPYGLYDMAGNAAEWVDAWYGRYPRATKDVVPEDYRNRDGDISEHKYKVYRGGSWNSFGKYLRCANREKEKPDKAWLYIGFRCVMDPPWKTRPEAE